MTTIPDAPWIRAAECFGVDDGGTYYVTCPVCEEECDEIYLDGNGEAVGCEHCMRIQSAYDWMQDMIERSRPE